MDIFRGHGPYMVVRWTLLLAAAGRDVREMSICWERGVGDALLTLLKFKKKKKLLKHIAPTWSYSLTINSDL
jgi:hypothetical protein